MEALRNSSGDELLEALQVRKLRRRKAKASTVSARLNPNFDVKAVALNSATETQLNSVKTHAGQYKPPPCLAPTPLTIASNLERMSLLDRQEITPSFKITMLKATLDFLKDPSQLTLQYPEMSLPNAQFLFNLIDPSKERDSNVGLGFKSLYSSLYELMHELKKEIQFNICFENTSDVETTKLTLTKVPKKLRNKEVVSTNKKKKKNVDIDPRVIQELKNQNWFIISSKAERKVFNRESIVKDLPELFLRNCLNKFVKFVRDPQMASLEFKNVNVQQSRFLECLSWTSNSSLTSPSCEGFHKLFSPECEALLKSIRRTVGRGEWSLRIEIGKLTSLNTRWVTFFKTPCYRTDNETQNASGDNSTDESKTVKYANSFNITIKNSPESDRSIKITSKDEKGPGNKVTSNIETPKLNVSEVGTVPHKTKSKSKKKKSKPNNSDIKETIRSETDGSRLDRSDTKEVIVISSESDSEKCKSNKELSVDSKEKGDYSKNLIIPGVKKGHRKLTAINFQSAGSLTLEEGVSGGAGDGGGAAGGVHPPLASSKARLLKALTTPIEGGVAERIMRKSMGWEGGALGARGEGIVEPIMPAIHLKPGAGLGHVRASPLPTISVVAFRLRLLTTLLSLLRSPSTEASISFSQPLTEKHYRFFKPVLKSLNKRRKPGWDGPEVDLLREISEEMLKHQHLEIDFSISKDLREFYLWKGPKPVLMSEKLKSTTDDVIRVVVETANDIETQCVSKKGGESFTNKIKFLEKIKDFVANKNEIEEYKFDFVMNKKMKRYLEMIVIEMNKGVLVKKQTDIENEILREIWQIGKDWTVNIKFGERSFKLNKKLLPLNKNKITKTETPRLISADLKNTIVYVNNKAIPAEKYIEMNSRTPKDDGKIDDDAANDVHNIDNSSKDKNDEQANIANYDQNVSIASDIKALVSDSKRDNNTTVKTSIDRVSKESSKVGAFDSVDDVNMYDCDANKNVNDETINSASDEDSKFMLPDSDEFDSCHETDLVETDLESFKTSISNDVSTGKNKSRFVNVNNDDYIKNRDGIVNKNKRLRSFVDEIAASDNKLTFPATNDSVANDPDNLESDYESSNANMSLENEDNVSTKLSSSDTEYDNFKSDLHSEVNNNHYVDKDRNQTNQNAKEYLHNSSPKKRSSTQTDERSPKKCKFVKFVSLKRKDREEIGMESVKFIQKLILDVIDENVFLPLLKCHGIQNGELVYSCHNQDSYDWLKSVMNIVSDVEMTDINYNVNMLKFSFKITSFVEEKAATVFNRLQMYNSGLSSEKWKVLKKQQYDNFIEFHVRVDKNSFRYISENNFSLYVGIDKAQFHILWN